MMNCSVRCCISFDFVSHDLDYIDGIKRNSGVRSLVLDPFFNAWEPAGILAYLRDPEHYVNGRDILSEGGGKYLERREIMNIFAQNLKKMYPGLDISHVKKEQEKYRAVKMCNFKGCNLAFPDSKALTKHRKEAHVEMRHDHSDQLYTCPNKGCHRRKKSKGFLSITALREHQLRMEHWGAGIYHGGEEPTECDPVTEENAQEMIARAAEAAAVLAAANGVQNLDDDEPMSPIQDTSQQTPSRTYTHATPQQPLPQAPPNHSQRTSIVQQSLHAPDLSMLPLMHDPTSQLSSQDQHLMHIDPAIQGQQSPHAPVNHMQAQFQGQLSNVPQSSMGNDMTSVQQHHQVELIQRYQQLQEELTQLRTVLIQSGMAPMQ
jgi:hypothetical protein